MTREVEMTPTRRSDLPIAMLVWLTTGVAVTAPLWLAIGPAGLPLGLLGPAGILFFKPGSQVATKVVPAALFALPSIIGLAIVTRKWSRLGTTGRILSVISVSTLWHGIASGLWWLALSGLN